MSLQGSSRRSETATLAANVAISLCKMSLFQRRENGIGARSRLLCPGKVAARCEASGFTAPDQSRRTPNCAFLCHVDQHSQLDFDTLKKDARGEK